MAQKEYLKMTDFFYGELSANDDEGIGSIIDADGEYVMQAMENGHMSACSNKGRNEHRKRIAMASAHAINSHDELVAEVERLRGALSKSAEAIGKLRLTEYGRSSFMVSRGEIKEFAAHHYSIAIEALNYEQ